MQPRLLHYRIDLFNQLRERCASRNIELRLVHGQATASEKVRQDEGTLDWADRVTNRYVSIGGRDILWQPLTRDLARSDLVVVMQENRILSNYPLLFGLKPAMTKIAYWGHGQNFQSRAPDGLREKWKKWLINRVDWWFAYTQMTVDLLNASGYPSERISCLNNAVDTKAFASQVSAIREDERVSLRESLACTPESKIAIFCGSLYPDKRLELMVAAGDLICKGLKDFCLVVIGDGPSAGYLREIAKTRSWLHMVGTQRGQAKAAYFSIADVMLNPGLLGLHILDSFSIGLPLISTTDAPHSPEVAYLESGVNGEMVANDAVSYANAVLKILVDPVYRQRISAGASAAGQKFSVENMVETFEAGILKCLEHPSLH